MVPEYHVIGTIDGVRGDLSGWQVRIDGSPAYFTVQAAARPARLEDVMGNKLLVINVASGQFDVIASGSNARA